MRRRGYNTRLSAGTIMAGARLDPIIPPSVLAIIIATLAKISTASLLVAGIIPGLLLMRLFLIYVTYRVWRYPSLAPDVAADSAGPGARISVLTAVIRMVPCAFVFFMVMGLIMFGVATPAEAAATGVFGAVVVVITYRKFSLRMMVEALASAATEAALLLVMMCRDVQPAAYLHRRHARGGRAGRGPKDSRPLMRLAIMALPFVLFMFLDQLALMLVLIPIHHPLLKLYAFYPIWFWTLFLIVAMSAGLRRRSATCCSRSRVLRRTCRPRKFSAPPGRSSGSSSREW
jgi:TRAP-type C4-dicarboxylate transport system permease large subunit